MRTMFDRPVTKTRFDELVKQRIHQLGCRDRRAELREEIQWHLVRTCAEIIAQIAEEHHVDITVSATPTMPHRDYRKTEISASEYPEDGGERRFLIHETW